MHRETLHKSVHCTKLTTPYICAIHTSYNWISAHVSTQYMILDSLTILPYSQCLFDTYTSGWPDDLIQRLFQKRRHVWEYFYTVYSLLCIHNELPCCKEEVPALIFKGQKTGFCRSELHRRKVGHLRQSWKISQSAPIDASTYYAGLSQVQVL